METYRSGHNGADSKSVCEQSRVSSNLTVSAKCGFHRGKKPQDLGVLRLFFSKYKEGGHYG